MTRGREIVSAVRGNPISLTPALDTVETKINEYDNAVDAAANGNKVQKTIRNIKPDELLSLQ